MKQLFFLILGLTLLLPDLKAQSQPGSAKPFLFETAFLNDPKVSDTNTMRFHAIDLGSLRIESGKLIVCDPVQVNNAKPISYDFPKGSFPIQVAFSYIDSSELDSLHYVSYCRVKFSDAPVDKWILLHYDQGRKSLPGSKISVYQYTVFSESGLILDQSAREELIKWPFSRWANLFVDTVNNPGVINSWKLKVFGKHNLAAFSGFDTATFKVYIGMDANKRICRFLVDTGLFLLPQSQF